MQVKQKKLFLNDFQPCNQESLHLKKNLDFSHLLILLASKLIAEINKTQQILDGNNYTKTILFVKKVLENEFCKSTQSCRNKTSNTLFILRSRRGKVLQQEHRLNDFYRWVFKIEINFGMNVDNQKLSKLKRITTIEELKVAHFGLNF